MACGTQRDMSAYGADPGEEVYLEPVDMGSMWEERGKWLTTQPHHQHHDQRRPVYLEGLSPLCVSRRAAEACVQMVASAFAAYCERCDVPDEPWLSERASTLLRTCCKAAGLDHVPGASEDVSRRSLSAAWLASSAGEGGCGLVEASQRDSGETSCESEFVLLCTPEKLLREWGSGLDRLAAREVRMAVGRVAVLEIRTDGYDAPTRAALKRTVAALGAVEDGWRPVGRAEADAVHARNAARAAGRRACGGAGGGNDDDDAEDAVLVEAPAGNHLEDEARDTRNAWLRVSAAAAAGGALMALTGGAAAPSLAASLLGYGATATVGADGVASCITGLFASLGAGVSGLKARRRFGRARELRLAPLRAARSDGVARFLLVPGWCERGREAADAFGGARGSSSGRRPCAAGERTAATRLKHGEAPSAKSYVSPRGGAETVDTSNVDNERDELDDLDDGVEVDLDEVDEYPGAAVVPPFAKAPTSPGRDPTDDDQHRRLYAHQCSEQEEAQNAAHEENNDAAGVLSPSSSWEDLRRISRRAPPDENLDWWRQVVPYASSADVVVWEEAALERLHAAMVEANVWVQARDRAARGLVDELLRRSTLGAAALPLAVLDHAAALDDPWAVAIARAKRAGEKLAEELLAPLRDRKRHDASPPPVTLVGYSVGARVIVHALEALDDYVSSERDTRALGLVENAVLLGAPVAARPRRWVKARRVVAGRLVNGYSTRDWMLRLVYRTKAWSLCGVAGAEPVAPGSRDDAACGPAIENCDLSDLVIGHLSYPYVMPQIFARLRLET